MRSSPGQLHVDAMRYSEKILRAASEVSVLTTVLTTLEPGGDGRRRYVTPAIDGICTAEPKKPQPPAVPLIEP